MGVILGAAFFGISVLAHRLQPTLSEDETLLSIMGGAVFGDGTRSSTSLLQFSTFAILILAANTAFAGLPAARRRSSPATASCPASWPHRGDRLVFSNGIIVLAAAAASC